MNDVFLTDVGIALVSFHKLEIIKQNKEGTYVYSHVDNMTENLKKKTELKLCNFIAYNRMVIGSS